MGYFRCFINPIRHTYTYHKHAETIVTLWKTNIAIRLLKMAIEIDYLPIKNGDFP